MTTEELYCLEWPIARYRFDFEVTTPLRLPGYAGSAIRGAFGRSLRRTACMTHMKECKSCPLYRSCPYTRIFETPAPQNHVLQNFSQIPNAYVIEPPLIGEKIYEIGETFSINIVLIGSSRDQLALVIYAIQRAFNYNIGHGTAKLLNVFIEHNNSIKNIYNANTKESISEHCNVLKINRLNSNSVILNINTPLRLQNNGKILNQSEITAPILLTALIRRTSLLMEFQAGVDLHLDFSSLTKNSHQAKLEKDLHWYNWERFSSRQHTKMNFGGWIGEIYLSNIPEEILPFLSIGEYIHVGKNATFGLGKYVINETSNECNRNVGIESNNTLIYNNKNDFSIEIIPCY